ncbi:MAG TPA: serine hydrolase domain-containing protein [Methylomirabilota bacterium]|jgi:CubicO group peptidase (beta-lactamase class C family)|nr:serine hydrolase domain-containing protein [Methylomirabilota bacterium]
MQTANPIDLGFSPKALDRIITTIVKDVAQQRYDSAVVIVARSGQVALHEAIGFADRVSNRLARPDDVFCLFSVTKTLTAAAVLQLIDHGQLALTTKVAEVIPEFGCKGKQRVTVAHLLTHTGGMSAGFPPVPPELTGNLEAVVAAVCQQGLEAIPGQEVSYSPITAHAILGEIVRRLDGGARSLREIFAAEIFRPLGMMDTALGLRNDLAPRRVPVVVRDRSEGMFPPDTLESFNVTLKEDTEIPGGGAVSTAADIFRFAEMLRQGGELDGVRILSPAIIELATANHTGLKPNSLWHYARELRGWDEFPAYLGLSFFLRGEGIFPTYFGTMASPGTFGGIGAGSTMFWVDPERDLTFVCLTAGLLEESHSLDRFQRLSDLVHAAVID